MSAFESELSRRLWWCIYLLDRRLAIETGRPFLIQDVNVDVALPQNVSDASLTMSRDASDGVDIGATAPENGPTTVPYLIAMTSYSRVIGKVWEALYGAATSESMPSPLLSEYLEHLINQAQRGIHQEFTYDPHHPTKDEAGGRAWWKVKQQFMMRIVRGMSRPNENHINSVIEMDIAIPSNPQANVATSLVTRTNHARGH